MLSTKILPTIIMLLTHLFLVTSKFNCVGTCYSGLMFPEPRDIVNGKHLKGFSYKNISTDDPAKCYSSCVQDCRCKACQMKDARCEFLDEDKNSKTLRAESGYVYFDLRQTMYQGSSHLKPSGVQCYNGCCRSNPCLNGGKCTEQCISPKEKFTCTCTNQYEGRVCQTRVFYSSCRDAFNKLPHATLKDGVYLIKRPDNKKLFNVYCQFNIKTGNTWVVIESFALKSKDLFIDKPFDINFSVNQYASVPKWEAYRLGLEDMQYFKGISTLFRSTCSYEKRGMAAFETDYISGQLSKTDIFENPIYHICKNFTKCNINGSTVEPCTARLYHQYGMHIHIDPWPQALPTPLCTFTYKSDVGGADFFGFYQIVDPLFKCTATQDSTTQWWLGD